MKAGFKTTEFWLSLLAIVIPVIEGLQHFPSPWIALPAAAIAGAYSLSRSQAKKAESAAAAIAASVAPSVLAAQKAAQLPTFGAMTQAELDASRVK